MFYYLDGVLAFRDANTAVIDCQGVGYKCTISLLTSEALNNKNGTRVKLFTHLNANENGIELFGFISNDELETFKLLNLVSGVGPKAALSILSILPPDRLRYCIVMEDVKSIAKAPGIGSKTAARIVLELKDKVSKDVLDNGTSITMGGAKTSNAPITNTKLADALEALMSLGYDRPTALSALRGLDPDKMSLNDLIASALKKFL